MKKDLEGKSRFCVFLRRNAFALTALLLALLAYTADFFFAQRLTAANEFYAKTIGYAVSAVPFSLYGLIITCALPLLALLVYLLIASKRRLRVLSTVLGIIFILLALFPVSYGFGYSGESAYVKLNVEVTTESRITEQNKGLLLECITDYVAKVNRLAGKIEYEEGHSVSDLTFDEIGVIISNTYADGFFGGLYAYTPKAKQFEPSAFMNYTGISGVYCYPFAEPNVCANMPQRSLPLTMAHELSHAKGVNNEGEANFCAFAACVRADDVFVNYSGYTYALSVLLNCLYGIDKQEYSNVRQSIDQRILDDYAYNSSFYARYDGFFDRLGSWINDLFLKSNGVGEGVASYSMSVRGILAYYEQYQKNADG